MSGLLLAVILLATLIVIGLGAWRCYRLFTMLRRPKPAPQARWYTGLPTFAPGQVTFTPPPPPMPVKVPPPQIPAPPAQAASAEETQKLHAVKKEKEQPPKVERSPTKPYKDLFPPPDPDEAAELEADTALLLSMPTPRHVLPKKPPVTSTPEASAPAASAPVDGQSTESPADPAPSEPEKTDAPPPDERPDSVPM